MGKLSLKMKLENIERVFDISKIVRINAKENYIKEYYKKSGLAYSLLHNRAGFVHMAISSNKRYRKEDLLTSPKRIEKEFRSKIEEVLELACGRGANLIYLAKKHPHINFQGIDLSNAQLKYLKKKIRKIRNLEISLGDYHNLKKFKKGSVDLVFVIEALCHSTKKGEVLKEVYRILKKDGKLIVIDGYKNKKKLTREENISLELIAKGMAVQRFEEYDQFIKYVKKQKFKIFKEEDRSKNILPSLYRFEKMAEIYLKNKTLARSINLIFPMEFTNNVLSGYLMPDLIKRGVTSYKITVLKK